MSTDNVDADLMGFNSLNLAIVTDAWSPQVNGVVRSLQRVINELRSRGDVVTVISPDQFRTIPCPTYPEIRLALTGQSAVSRVLDAARPDYIHIATEGPLGILARGHCLSEGRTYTTSYHTKFPEYVSARMPFPRSWLYAFVRRFHNGGSGCMVATNSLRDDLDRWGFQNLMLWSRGVDARQFHPRPDIDLGLPRPVFVYVGRVSVEKNLEAFLKLNLPGSKLVVGDGPARNTLERRFGDVHFAGMKQGEELGRAYAGSDVFVFPSLTDTFGNVLIEALSSGLPVAAFPVTGPKDIITSPRVGVLSDDLEQAAIEALNLKPEDAVDFARKFSWKASTETFRRNVLAGHRSSHPARAGIRRKNGRHCIPLRKS